MASSNIHRYCRTASAVPCVVRVRGRHRHEGHRTTPAWEAQACVVPHTVTLIRRPGDIFPKPEAALAHLEPVGVDGRLGRCQNLDEAPVRHGRHSVVVGSREVAVQRRGVELGEAVNLQREGDGGAAVGGAETEPWGARPLATSCPPEEAPDSAPEQPRRARRSRTSKYKARPRQGRRGRGPPPRAGPAYARGWGMARPRPPLPAPRLNDARVQAIGYGNVDQAVVGAEGHGRLGAGLGQRVEARPGPAPQDDAEDALRHLHLPLVSESGRTRSVRDRRLLALDGGRDGAGHGALRMPSTRPA